MKTKKVDPMTGLMSFFRTMASGNLGPHDQITAKLHNETVIVDSSLPSDTEIWETGINRLNIEGEWVIVEQYEDKTQAIKGHNKWVNKMEKSPELPLKDIDMWSLDDE